MSKSPSLHVPALDPLSLLLQSDECTGKTRRGLDVAEAWQIATAWQQPLQKKVWLVADTEDCPRTSILDSYAWVHVDIPLDDFQAVCVARAAALTWLALSNCHGYSGRANPTFWRCVFSAYSKPSTIATSTTTSQRGQRSRYNNDNHEIIHDSIGFFDQVGHEFPRFQLNAHTLEHGEVHVDGVRRFCGLSLEEFHLGTRFKLEALLTRMEQHANTHVHVQQHRVVDVSLSRLCTNGFAMLGPHRVRMQAFGFLQIKPNPRADYNPQALGTVLPQLLAASDTSTDLLTKPLSAAPFRVSHLDFDPGLRLRNDADVDKLDELLQHATVAIGALKWPIWTSDDHVSGKAMATLVASVLALRGHGIQAKTTTICLPESRPLPALTALGSALPFATSVSLPESRPLPALAALVSALPFATSVHSVQLSVSAHDGHKFNTHDLPWLAYAMFHPDAEMSSWRSLVLQNVVLDDTSASVVAAMARGNNLQALLDGTEPQSDAYYSARLAHGTAIMADASDEAQVLLLNDDTKSEVNSDQRVDVCGISSLDAATWTSWVAVVVPAYGLGYVRSQYLVDVHARAPSQLQLTSLTIQGQGTHARLDPEPLVAFIKALGDVRQLQFLDVSEYCMFDGSASPLLRQVLEQCSSLTTLAVTHCGQLWSRDPPVVAGDDDANGFPQLRQLELHLAYSQTRFEKPSLHALQSTLSQLEVLRVRACDDDQYRVSHRAIKLVLQHALQLRHFHWQYSLLGGGQRLRPVSYQETRAWTTQLLQAIHWEDGRHLAVDTKFSLPCITALLSCVAAPRGATTAPSVGLDRDVVTQICQFATSRVRKVITIQPPLAWGLQKEIQPQARIQRKRK